VRSYLAAAIRDVKDRLKRAKARARRELKLELQSAWVDDTPSGARRLSYRRGHDRSYEAALKRLDKLKKERPDEGGSPEDDPDDGIETDETQATEPGPVVETTGEDGPGASGLGVGDSADTDTGSATTHDIAPSGKHEIRNPKRVLPRPAPQAPFGRWSATKTNPFCRLQTSQWGWGHRSQSLT